MYINYLIITSNICLLNGPERNIYILSCHMHMIIHLIQHGALVCIIYTPKRTLPMIVTPVKLVKLDMQLFFTGISWRADRSFANQELVRPLIPCSPCSH